MISINNSTVPANLSSLRQNLKIYWNIHYVIVRCEKLMMIPQVEIKDRKASK